MLLHMPYRPFHISYGIICVVSFYTISCYSTSSHAIFLYCSSVHKVKLMGVSSAVGVFCKYYTLQTGGINSSVTNHYMGEELKQERFPLRNI